MRDIIIVALLPTVLLIIALFVMDSGPDDLDD